VTGLAVAVVVVVVVGAAVFLARRVQHPEQTATHADLDKDRTTDRFHRTDDRPAGPGAEDPVGPTRIRDDPPPSPPH
jgi:hypothetical protein